MTMSLCADNGFWMNVAPPRSIGSFVMSRSNAGSSTTSPISKAVQSWALDCTKLIVTALARLCSAGAG